MAKKKEKKRKKGKGRGGSRPVRSSRVVYPQLPGDAFGCLGVTTPLFGDFRRRWEPDVPAVVPVEQRSRCAIRATETEWHRNRSVATSRGAWLPGAHLYGRLRSASGKAWEAQLLDAERRRERGREREMEALEFKRSSFDRPLQSPSKNTVYTAACSCFTMPPLSDRVDEVLSVM